MIIIFIPKLTKDGTQCKMEEGNTTFRLRKFCLLQILMDHFKGSFIGFFDNLIAENFVCDNL